MLPPEDVCPYCGARLDSNGQGAGPTSDFELAGYTAGVGSGSVSRSGSGDDPVSSSTSGFPMISGEPDPLLGVLARADAADFEADPPTSSNLPSSSSDALSGLNFDAPRSTREPVSVGPELEEEIVYVNGPSWPLVLLASYASAVTLALIWWVVIPRIRGKSELDGFVGSKPAAAVGTRRADLSRKVEPVVPLPGARVTRLGRPITIGSLEITPLEIARKDVKLIHTSISGDVEEREGGIGALSLRFRFRNISKDAVFAPLDEAFLRDRDDGASDSFVQVGDQRVYLYPLPVESEWSIVGQEFFPLKPGEIKETLVITAAEFPATSAAMTWRIRLRVGIDDVQAVGVEVPSSPR